MSHIDTTKAVYKFLTETLSAKVEGVFDLVPEGQPGPYVQVGQIQSLRGSLLNDSDRSWYVDLHIWSDYQGRKEVLEIADTILASLPIEWFAEELVVLQDVARSSRIPSGWYHGVLTIKGYDGR